MVFNRPKALSILTPAKPGTSQLFFLLCNFLMFNEVGSYLNVKRGTCKRISLKTQSLLMRWLTGQLIDFDYWDQNISVYQKKKILP